MYRESLKSRGEELMWQGEGKVQKPSGYTAEVHSERGTASRGGFQHDGGMTHGLCNREL